MKRVLDILENIIWEVSNGTNLKESVKDNCETEKDRNDLIKYIGNMALNRLCLEVFAETYNIEKLGFESIDELQNFIYVCMWNNPEINNL